MAARSALGADGTPQLVVKIIGSKLIKYYTNEPKIEKTVDCGESPGRPDLPHSVENEVVNLSPDREEEPPSQPLSKQLLEQEGKDEDPLVTMVREEVKEWGKEALQIVELELQELDSAHTGTVDQFHLTHVHYEKLLRFIGDAVLNEEGRENTEPEVRSASHRSVSAHSKHPAASVHPEMENWLQRFHRMEEAMQMGDTQNSGFIDKDEARRLIQNYNLIFNLNLSLLKIDEAIRGAYQNHYGKALVLAHYGYKKLEALFRLMADSVEVVELEGHRVVSVKAKIRSRYQPALSYHLVKPHCSAKGDSPGSVLSQQYSPQSSVKPPGREQQSGSGSMSYRDALRTANHRQPGLPVAVTPHSQGTPATPQSDTMSRLKASLRTILHRHPEGVSLAQVRRSCPLLYDPGVLEGYASSKQVLASLTDVVRLSGIGVQTRVHLATAQM
ncbi:hypothetical protein JZ751_024870 [Albula glossodonta]|uniref:EF-hand domain-containing protein n=1 Tax=Albula glossodonta TaxID=121402 RepID=A0A8T2PIK3_9TELE|nr:hypothetical protein JZ751_024870 [Albula glossodonta]